VYANLLTKAVPYIQKARTMAETGFMTTAKGYLGRALAEVVKGDIIAVLLERTLLFLLRKDGNYYRIIGDCYVHGIMDGEMFESNPMIETLVIK
jgi:hypothetical protein